MLATLAETQPPSPHALLSKGSSNLRDPLLGANPRRTLACTPPSHQTCSPNELGGVGAVKPGRSAAHLSHSPSPETPYPSPRSVLPSLRGRSPVLVLKRAPPWPLARLGSRAPPSGKRRPRSDPLPSQPEAAAARPRAEPRARADLPTPHPGASGRPGVRPRSRRDLPVPRPRRRRLRPGPDCLPRRLSALPAACLSVRPRLAPGPPAQPRPCPQGVTWPRGWPEDTCLTPPLRRPAQSSRAPAQPYGRGPRDCATGGVRGGAVCTSCGC